MSRPGLLHYCQHSLGLGHLARSFAVAGAAADRFRVVMLNGGRLPEGFAVPDGVEVVNLPPLGLDPDTHKLVSHDPHTSVAAALERRRAQLLAALDDVDPAVVLVEQFPFGRKKFAPELEPLLEAAAARPRPPQIVCSLRDILVSGRRDQAEFDERASCRANRWFDAILVHADPTFARLDETFRPSTPLRVPVHYTGFVTPPARLPEPGERAESRVLVSAGGGLVGSPLFRAAVAAHRQLFEEAGLTTTIVTGPFVPSKTYGWLVDEARRSPILEVVRVVDDLCGAMRRSAVTVSQCGYNTAMDVLRAGTAAVVVPYADGQEDEQTRRAERLADLGALRLVPATELDGDRLRTELVRLTAFTPARVALDLDGRAASARILAELADRAA